ncbi:DUF6498-containing protein [Congregibacter variabilis]|uniref:DUF6498-containing protein n=1 Tax=Congregibacter variabilis TaxID=3081200 RepID=A0ABZ0HZ27_9GAMM|nr:DUF6498-containing protein [Congregibacter sp. IMCC43200]
MTPPNSPPPQQQPTAFYQGRRRQLNLALLITANLLPLLGVLLFDWDVGALIILYWSENLILGAYNVIKMASVGGIQAVFPSLFFLMHYGGFCAVHGFFILRILFDAPTSFGDETPWPLFLVFLQLLFQVVEQVFALAPREWVIAFIGLTISHGYSFVSNFLIADERASATVNGLMAAPYKRIVILHITIIAGGFAIMSLGQPLFLLIVLVGLKTAMDVGLHVREHRKAAVS